MSDVCQRCGACCAAFRVSFYWAESEANSIPSALTRRLNPWMSCMAGTQQPAPRCVALQGEVGQAVACAIYDRRPSPCKEVIPGDDKCKRARERHGLPPL